MRLIVISGFLGTGKTTLIVKAARQAVKQKMKVAILVNEIGDVGIDDQYMRKLGMNVWEILGGCICCTLAGNLGEALDRLYDDYHPDLVLMEPSGAADPRAIEQILSSYSDQAVMQVHKVTIIDPLRLDMMMAVLTPLITSQIQTAEMVIINKQDAASAEEMAQAMRIVDELNPEITKICLSVRDETDERVMEILPP
jgi:G3E family GTPase